MHPVFNSRNLWNDFALLHVKSIEIDGNDDFDLDQHLNVMCLPTSSDYEDFDKSQCVATGWGEDSIGKCIKITI